MKFSFSETKQAFEKAIKTVGVENFKKTSMFMRNDSLKAKEEEHQLAA